MTRDVRGFWNSCELPTMPSKKRVRKKTVTDQLILAIEESGQSRYAISMATGIDQGQLSKFVHGERGLSLATVDTLCSYLGLELRQAPRKRR